MKKTLKIIAYILLFCILIISILALLFFSDIYKNREEIAFNISKITNPINTINFNLYDNDNNLIEIDNTSYVKLDEINPLTLQAFISIEDKNFYKHNGINLKRMIKATINNLVSHSFKEGASTISQQLIKNTHLSSEKTLKRKIKEIIITQKMEKQLTKDEILEYYLNLIYFGNNSYGIKEASNNYFNKEPKDLTLAESAMLAGIIKAPSKYSPYKNYNLCLDRRNLVLKEMLKDNRISKEDYDEAISLSIELNISKEEVKNNKNTNLYEKLALEEAKNLLNLDYNELQKFKIYTYKNTQENNELQKLINDDSYYQKNNYGKIPSGMAIILNNETGGVEAFCGRSDFELSNIKRQPGSAIKPILVYAPALDEGLISPATKILDKEININGYKPNNVGGFHGYVSIREAVSKSLNIPAIKVAEKVGLDNCKTFAEKAGIQFSNIDNNYAITLGGFTDGITLQQLTNSYLPYTNDGNFIKSTFIKEIRNADGLVVYKHNKSYEKVMNDDTAYLMTDLLISGVKDGTSKKLSNLPFEIAGKTGTVAVDGTNYNSDAISIAYTSNKTMGVWLGNYTMKNEDRLESTNNGGTFATALIRDTFKELYKDSPPRDFKVPNSVKEVEIDTKSYENNKIELASSKTPERYIQKELFSKRFLPTEISKNFNDYKIKNFSASIENNQLIIDFDADDFVDYKICVYSEGEEQPLDEIVNSNGNIKKKYNAINFNDQINVYIKYSICGNKKEFISNKIKLYNNKEDYYKIKSNQSSFLWN